jgi:hypothetical protein
MSGLPRQFLLIVVRCRPLCLSYGRKHDSISNSYDRVSYGRASRQAILTGSDTSMRNQIENWLAGDWIILGTQVQHRTAVIAAIAVVALLIAWFERPKRRPRRYSPGSYAADHD